MGFFRTFLALSVFSWHMSAEGGHFLLNGAYSVLSFYVISGFLMSLTFEKNYQSQEGGVSRFFLNRFLRIYPPYWIVIGLTVLFHYFIGQNDPFLGYQGSPRDVPLVQQSGLALSNIVVFGMDILTFLNNSDLFSLPVNARLFGPSWSIACEVLFYVGVPFITRRSTRVLLSLIVVAAAMRWQLGQNFPWRYEIDPWRYYIAPSTWIFFLLGMLSFRLAKPICAIVNSSIATLLVLAAALAVMIFAGFDRFASLDSLAAWTYYIALALALPVLWNASKNITVDDYVGRISYPIYLLHPFLIACWDYFSKDTFSEPVRYLILTSGLLACATLLYLAVERPIEFARAFVRQRSASKSAVDQRATTRP